MRSNRSGSKRGGAKTTIIVLLLLLLLCGAVFTLLKLNQKRINPPSEPSAGNVPALEPGGETPSELVISEIRRGDNGFVEIFNNSSKTVELSDFCLSDDYNKTDKWRFPKHQLEAGKYAVVLLRGSGFTGDALYGENLDDGTVCPVFNATFKLNTEESGVYLFSRGARADSISFDPAMPEPVCVIRVGGGFAYTGAATPGKANAERYFTSLGWKDMDASDPVRINEVLPKNKYDITDHDGDRCDWVELYNASPNSVNLGGYYLSDDEFDLAKWALPDVTLESGEYLLIFLSGKDHEVNSEIHASFKLSSSDSMLFLTDFNSMHRDAISIPEELSDNVSIGRGDDGSLLYYAKPTPGKKNTTAGFTEHMGVGGFNPSSVYISEVCAVTEARSGQLDWLELHNPSSAAIDLSGWHISNDANDLGLFALSSVKLPANGYAVISCTDRSSKSWANPAPFSISSAGETLYLSDADGTVVDVFETGALRFGVTSGRENGTTDGARVFFTTPTRGSENAKLNFSAYANAPVFSDTELYKSAPFALEISSNGGTVHYTLDGTKPTANSPVYTAPITVDKNTVVRAVTCEDGLIDSEIVTATYLFETKHTLPVVTISIDPDDFAEVSSVNQPNMESIERECFMQFYEKDGTLGLDAPAGVRVSGASTKRYLQKSFGIYFRGGYGKSSVSYPFFGSDYITNFSSLVLRNAGQDWGGARIRDSFTSTAVLGMNLDASAARFCVVYINGEYWGLYDLKENMNEDYLASHYGVDPDTANIIKRNTVELEGSNTEFLRVRSFVVQNEAVIPLDDARYAQFTQWVDAESIADYLIARQYFPDLDMFNQKYWRTTDYKIRWRAVFFDSDFALSGAQSDVLHCYFDVKGVPSVDGSLSQMDLYCGLESNEKWRHDFLVRYIYVTKYYLNTERLLPLFDDMAAQIEPEIARQIDRWDHPESYETWKSEIEKLRNNIIERPQYSKQNLMYVMQLSDADYRALEAEADAIHQANGGVFK